MRLWGAGLPTLRCAITFLGLVKSLCSLRQPALVLPAQPCIPCRIYTIYLEMMIVILINLFVNVNMCVLNGNICTATENVGRCADHPSWLNNLGKTYSHWYLYLLATIFNLCYCAWSFIMQNALDIDLVRVRNYLTAHCNCTYRNEIIFCKIFLMSYCCVLRWLAFFIMRTSGILIKILFLSCFSSSICWKYPKLFVEMAHLNIKSRGFLINVFQKKIVMSWECLYKFCQPFFSLKQKKKINENILDLYFQLIILFHSQHVSTTMWSS